MNTLANVSMSVGSWQEGEFTLQDGSNGEISKDTSR